MDYHKMKKLTSKLALLVTFVMLICSGCEDIVDAITGYEEAQAEEEVELSIVTVSVYYTGVHYNNGEPYVTARGKVKNHGPNPIWSIRVLATTNWGNYGHTNNPKCSDCTAHCGYEATAVNDSTSSLKNMIVSARVAMH